MKNSNKKENFIICGYDGGTIFTVTVLVSLVISLVASFVLVFTGKSSDEQFLQSAFYAYLGFGLSPVALCLVSIFAVKKYSLNFRQAVCLKKCNKKYIFITALLFIGCVFGLSGLNTLFVNALSSITGYKASDINVPSGSVLNFILCTLIICVLPAFFEEIIFRGFVLNGCKRLGDVFAVVCSGILFSLFHHSPMQTVYQFIIGAVFAYLAIKSGSILPSIVFHFLNNFYIIVVYYAFGENFAFSEVLTVISVVLGLLCFIGGVYWLFKCEKNEQEEKLKKDFLSIADKKEEQKLFVIASLIGIFACAALWIADLISKI